jgi:hypothetical protein
LARQLDSAIGCIQGQTSVTECGQTEKGYTARPPHQSLDLGNKQPGAERTGYHLIGPSFQEGAVIAFAYCVDNHHYGRWGFRPYPASIRDRIASKGKHDQVGGSLHPSFHGSFQVGRCGHRKARALQYEREDCSLISIICE